MFTRPALGIEDARRIAAAAVDAATREKCAVVVAVLDDGGHVLFLERMDGAPPACVDVAIGKGRTAAVYRCPTNIFEQMVAARAGMATLKDTTSVAGGLPLLSGGHAVGGIGISGGQAHQDEAIAAAGAAVIG